MGVFDNVGLAGTATILDADAQAYDLGVRALGQLVDALRGSIGQPHDLRPGPLWLGCGRR
jgi:hypothetical protein